MSIIWWTAGVERDRRAGHPGDPRAPDAAGDDDDVGLDGPGVRVDAPDAAGLDVDAGDLDARGDGQRAHLLGGLAHQRAGLERVDDADARRVEAAEDDRLVDERDHLLDLGRRRAAGCPRRPTSVDDAMRRLSSSIRSGVRATSMPPVSLKTPELAVLAGAVDRERRHLLGVVGQEDEVRGVTGRAARVRERALLDQDDVAPAGLGEVVGHAVADDPGADDHDVARSGSELMPVPSSSR